MPGQTQGLAGALGNKAQGAGVAGALTQANSSEPGAESFRSSWQSLLASLGGGINGLAGEEQGRHSLSMSEAEILARSSEKGATATGSASDLKSAASHAVSAGKTLANAQAVIPAWRTSAQLNDSNVSTEVEKGTKGASRSESSSDAHAAKSSKNAKPQAGSLDAALATASGIPVPLPGLGAGVPKATVEGNHSSPVHSAGVLEDGSESAGGVSGARSDHLSVGALPLSSAAQLQKSSAAQTMPHPSALAVDGVDAADGGSSLSASSLNMDAPQDGKVEGHALNGVDRVGAKTTETVAQAQIAGQGTDSLAIQPLSLTSVASSNNSDPSVSESSSVSQVASVQGKPGLPGISRSAAQNTVRGTHTGSDVATAQQATHAPTALPPDGAGLSRDPSSVSGANRNFDGNGGTSSSTSAGSGGQETFAALDAGGAPTGQTWVHAGAQHAEAGYQDPTLGWIGVRADAGSGGVHASLVPGTADAAQALGGHLDGLNSYLAEHHPSVETVTMSAPSGNGAAVGADQSASQGMHQGPGQGNGQDGGQGAQTSSSQSSVAASSLRAESRSEGSGRVGTPDSAVQVGARGGHISVMA